MENPKLHVLEKEMGGTGHREREITEIQSAGSEKNILLKEAMEALVGNTSFYEEMLRAIEKKSGKSVRGLAEVENKFVSFCESLSPEDITNVVRKFNRGFIDWVITKKGQVNPKTYDSIISQKYNIKENGIVSVSTFIKARRKLLDSEPSQKYGFYFENGLDASYKIDLIECIFSDDYASILEMNLIQIKSSVPDSEEQTRILEEHEGWLHTEVMSLDDFEYEYTNGLPEELTIKSLAENYEQVKDLLLDLCTDPNGFNADKFIENLDLKNLNDKQKAWLVVKYGDILVSEVERVRKEGDVSEDEARQIIEKMKKLENSLRQKSKLPRDFSNVERVNSITAVGHNIIKNTQIMNAEKHGQRKILKRSK